MYAAADRYLHAKVAYLVDLAAVPSNFRTVVRHRATVCTESSRWICGGEYISSTFQNEQAVDTAAVLTWWGVKPERRIRFFGCLSVLHKVPLFDNGFSLFLNCRHRKTYLDSLFNNLKYTITSLEAWAQRERNPQAVRPSGG